MTIDGKKREVTEPPKLQAGERGGNLGYVKDVILLLIWSLIESGGVQPGVFLDLDSTWAMFEISYMYKPQIQFMHFVVKLKLNWQTKHYLESSVLVFWGVSNPIIDNVKISVRTVLANLCKFWSKRSIPVAKLVN